MIFGYKILVCLKTMKRKKIKNGFVLCVRRKNHLLIRSIFIFMKVLYVKVVMKIKVRRKI